MKVRDVVLGCAILLVGLFLGILWGVDIERFHTNYHKKQVEILLQLLTPETVFVNDKLPVLEDTFGLDRLSAITILSEVYRNAGLFDHDPDMILGLIEQESHFDPRATSSVKAKGLMQVMDWWFKWYNPGANQYDIRENIRMGCFVLWVYRNTSKTYEEALARYYAGANWDVYLDYSEQVLIKYKKWAD